MPCGRARAAAVVTKRTLKANSCAHPFESQLQQQALIDVNRWAASQDAELGFVPDKIE